MAGSTFVHGVTAQLGILIGSPVRTHVLAKLVVEVDLFALLGVGNGGGESALPVPVVVVVSVPVVSVGVVMVVLPSSSLPTTGSPLLHLGVGVHDGGAGRAFGVSSLVASPILPSLPVASSFLLLSITSPFT